MKNNGTLINFRAIGYGVCTAVLALACGSSDKNPTPDNGATTGTTPVPTTLPTTTDDCSTNPFLQGCPAPAGSTGTGTAATGTGTGAVNTDPAALAKAAAENVLLSDCGQCHGPQGNDSGGMNYINDIDQLVANNKIVPLDSADSLIIQRMKKGEMPPPPNAPVSDSDINVVAQFIDNPQFWPGQVKAGNCQDSGQLFTTDQLYSLINTDLQEVEQADDALNYRYISLSNRYNAGVCSDTSLDQDRNAINKMLNALSINSKPTAPVALDKDQLVYRIDLRDYDWNRAVSVNGTAFTDVWEAIVGNNQYAVPYTGTQADAAKLASGTQVPVMFGDSMLDEAAIGNLYYAIINIDINAENIDQFIANDLQINVQADLDDRNETRAGTTKSRVSRQDRLVERHDIGNRAGALYESFDFDAQANESIFQDPFGFNEGGREAIFNLPNGMMGFAIADANGNFAEDSDILLDTSQDNFKAVTSVSCSQCHSAGFIPVVDEVGPADLSNAVALQLNRDEVEEIQEIYPTPDQFAAITASDNTGFYQRALNQLKLPTQGADPVSAIFLQFDQDMTSYTAAGDLGVTPKQLLKDLPLLDPALQVLASTVQDRDDFTQFYVNSLCILSIANENAPEQAVCDAAQAAVDALDAAALAGAQAAAAGQ